MSVPPEEMQTPQQPSLADAVSDGITRAGDEPVPDTELEEVKKLNTQYTVARAFDKAARGQYTIDRRYAGGVSDRNWASDANIIGSFIDILVSFLYAQNPDVSVRPAPRAGGTPDQNLSMFAETLQIVVSRLWKDAKLKRIMRKDVRSALSVGPGWFKALIYSETKKNPQLEKEVGDVRDNLEQMRALQTMLGEDVNSNDPDARQQQIIELERQMEGLQAQVELLVKRGLCVDFCRAEDVQVSLDVADLSDYLAADWISNDMYIRKDAVRARFERVTAEELKSATNYYQRQTGNTNPDSVAVVAMTADQPISDGAFAKSTDNAGLGQAGSWLMDGEKPVDFVKVVELWDHRDNLIKTFIDGIKKWAVEPYPPPQASTRFYPYFQLAFYLVDGSRHPQSLTWRMRKLQDEYSHTRSNNRLVRERSVPGTILLGGELDPKDAEKIKNGDQLEMVSVNPTTPGLKIDQIITAKPIPRVDPLLYDTTPIVRDMQVVSGVQEAQAQQAAPGPNTATEADIQNQGFASRTGADRDMLEELLTDLAQYTAQLSIQSLPLPVVQKMAGPLAFWPIGMEVEDVLTMLDIEINAGTTGKPQARADKETWATLLPLIQQMIAQIMQMEASGNPIMLAQAKGYRNLLRETLKRLDDRLSLESILPPPVDPTKLGLPGAAPGGLPLGAPGAAPGAPPVGNGTVNNPGSQAPPPVAA